VFLNVPGHGHVNPMLAVAQGLVQRGERVIYYLTEDFRAAIEATGATFRGYESQMSRLQPSGNFTPCSMTANPLPFMIVNESAGVLPQMFERIRADQPDYILYDTMCLWAKIAAHALHVPAILFCPSYASNGQFNPDRMMGAGISENLPFAAFRQVDGRLFKLCRAYGVEPFPALEMFMGSEALNIVFIPREFQPGGETSMSSASSSGVRRSSPVSTRAIFRSSS